MNDTVAFIHIIEDGISTFEVNCGGVLVDDYITIDMTAVIATAIDITAFQTTVLVSVSDLSCSQIRCIHFVAISIEGVPYQGCIIAVPSLRLKFQTGKVENQFVTVGSTSKDTTFIGYIKFIIIIKLFRHIGIVTATYQLVEDNDLMSKINIDHSLSLDATYISSTIERTDLCGIRNISLTISCGIKYHSWFDTDGHSIHIFIELRLTIDLGITGKFHLAEVFTTHLALI